MRQTDGNGDEWWQGDLYKTQRYEDVVFSNEDEGSLYLVTFTVSALRPVGGALLQSYLEKDRLAWGGGYNKAKLKAQEQDDLANAIQIRFGSYCEGAWESNIRAADRLAKIALRDQERFRAPSAC